MKALQCQDCSHSDRCIGNISLPAASGAAVRAVPKSGSSWRRPAQLASSSKCWFNLYMPRFCQDVNLQQKAQSPPLFQTLLISRFSEMHPEIICILQLWAPEAPSLSSTAPLVHLSSPVMPFSRLSLHKGGPVLSLRCGGSMGQRTKHSHIH